MSTWKKWLMIGCIAAVVIAIVVLVLVLANKQNEHEQWGVSINGEKLFVGSSITEDKLLKDFDLTVMPGEKLSYFEDTSYPETTAPAEEYLETTGSGDELTETASSENHSVIRVTKPIYEMIPDYSYYEAKSEDGGVEIKLIPTDSGKYIVDSVTICSSEVDANINGLKVGEPLEEVRKVFPKAEFYYYSNGLGIFTFYIDKTGNVLSTAEFEKLRIEAKEDGRSALERLAKGYLVVRINFNFVKSRWNISEICVSRLVVED